MTVSPVAERVPRQSDVDAFGLTHPGKMRPANADQFLIVTLHKTTQVQSSSLPTALAKTQTSDARAYIFLVADGVGSGAGVHASEAALRHVMSYVTHATKLCYTVDAEEHDHFLEELKLAVARAHDEVHQDAQAEGVSGMATTLTLVAFIWPMGRPRNPSLEPSATITIEGRVRASASPIRVAPPLDVSPLMLAFATV